MISIKKDFGTIQVSDDLLVSIEGNRLVPSFRTLGEILPVLQDTNSVDLPKSTVLYSMYRGFSLEKHVSIFKSKKVRFDITVMANIKLGKEPNKTLGHYHPIAEDSLSYPELYQVIHGRATYLLQKKVGEEILDFVVANISAGEAILIPPGYGHVTVNSGGSVLVMVNLVSDSFQSVYDEYIKRRGAAYYLLTDGSLAPNPHYGRLPSPRELHKKFPVSKDLYSDFVSCPSCFDFLNRPSLVADQFRR
ncbi:MAG: glucose-6-phosphate isomerase family protein [Candidatus Methanomethylicaceae archaeon]